MTMMIKCHKCGRENQLGVIFCHKCGEKLDLNTDEPQVKDKKKFKWFKLFRNLIVLIIFLVLVLLICGVFIPFGFKNYELLDNQEAKTKVDEMCDNIDRIVDNGQAKNYTFVMTPKEATYAFNKVFVKKPQGDQKASEEKKPEEKKDDKKSGDTEVIETVASGEGNAESSEKFFFDVDSEKNIVIVIMLKWYNTVPARLEIVGTPVNPPEPEAKDDEEEGEKAKADGPKEIDFEIKSLKLGHVPIPLVAKRKILDLFEKGFSTELMTDYRKMVKSVTVDDDYNFVITFKDKVE